MTDKQADRAFLIGVLWAAEYLDDRGEDTSRGRSHPSHDRLWRCETSPAHCARRGLHISSRLLV